MDKDTSYPVIKQERLEELWVNLVACCDGRDFVYTDKALDFYHNRMPTMLRLRTEIDYNTVSVNDNRLDKYWERLSKIIGRGWSHYHSCITRDESTYYGKIADPKDCERFANMALNNMENLTQAEAAILVMQSLAEMDFHLDVDSHIDKTIQKETPKPIKIFNFTTAQKRIIPHYLDGKAPYEISQIINKKPATISTHAYNAAVRNGYKTIEGLLEAIRNNKM